MLQRRPVRMLLSIFGSSPTSDRWLRVDMFDFMLAIESDRALFMCLGKASLGEAVFERDCCERASELTGEGTGDEETVRIGIGLAG